MNEQNKPASDTAQQVIPSDAATLQLLVQLLLSERQDALAEKQELKRARDAKNAQRIINAEYAIKEKHQKQSICTHKKGGKGLKSPNVDFAVGFHTFVDATSYIRCFICGAKWRNTDTREYLIRRGEKIPNHTRIGWAEAYEMFSKSTNTATSSEVQIPTMPIAVDIGKLE